MIKFFVFLFVVSLFSLFFIFDFDQYLSLGYIKSQQENFAVFYANNPMLAIGGFIAVYIGVTSLSLPFAAILTLLAGALFGVVYGCLMVSFASTMGATIAFLVSRYLFSELVQRKYGHKLQGINKGIEKDGAYYLFALRLIPAIPFFLINILMGLTRIRALTFFFVSMAGMFPATVIYVFVGTQLAKIDSLAGILNPKLVFGLVLLGIFPLMMKKIVQWEKSVRVMRKFKKPTRFDYNMVVIGAGSAGLVSSYIAAAVKAKVALIEKHKMGGDCLNTGCVPSKSLIRSAKMLSYAKRASEFGFKSTKVDFDFADVMERVQNIIKKIEPHDSVERYTKLGVDCIEGEAKIIDPYKIEVAGKIITTKNIVIATGARPFVPPIKGLDKIDYYTSDNVWGLRKLPKRLVVLGGGPIGCEMAQAFSRFGAQVTVVEMAPQILIREDDEIAKIMSDKFASEGAKVLANHQAKEFVVEGKNKKLICDFAGKDVEVLFDEVIVAIGRKPNIEGFGLEELGVELSPRGTVEADQYLRTNYPNIYVCGDVTGPYQFTHVAAHQAWYVAVNALFSPFKKFKVDYSVVPWATFTDPEIARVGLNEKDAKDQGVEYEVTKYGIDDLDRAIADSEDNGFVKVLTVPGKDIILGVTIVGTHAGDLIAEFVSAMKHGIGLNKILGTIHIYPTLAEANKYVAGKWKKANAPLGVLAWLQRFHKWRR